MGILKKISVSDSLLGVGLTFIIKALNAKNQEAFVRKFLLINFATHLLLLYLDTRRCFGTKLRYFLAFGTHIPSNRFNTHQLLCPTMHRRLNDSHLLYFHLLRMAGWTGNHASLRNWSSKDLIIFQHVSNQNWIKVLWQQKGRKKRRLTWISMFTINDFINLISFSFS